MYLSVQLCAHNVIIVKIKFSYYSVTYVFYYEWYTNSTYRYNKQVKT
jgi:hypothetical protein